MKLTLIGNGKMALSLAKGLCVDNEIEVIGRDINKLNAFQKEVPSVCIKVLQQNEDITNKNIIVCVKPHALIELSKNLVGSAQTLYSVLAGTTLESLKANIKAKSYIRTMPNLGATFNQSMTTLTGDTDKKQEALEIFSKIGKTLWVNTQKELDIATAIAGSGPAYLALIAEALADAGVKCGLTRNDSQVLVQGLFGSMQPLLEESAPSMIKDSVMSPGGTTAAGYAALEQHNVRHGIIQAVIAAYEQANLLSKK